MKNKQIFLTNVIKDNYVPLYDFKFFGYKIKMYGKSTMKNITKSCKVLAKKMGLKNPKIFIYDNAKSIKGECIKELCWAVYAEEQ